jgi:hypothetical protein
MEPAVVVGHCRVHVLVVVDPSTGRRATDQRHHGSGDRVFGRASRRPRASLTFPEA